MIKSVKRTFRLSSGILKILASALSIGIEYLLGFDQEGFAARLLDRFLCMSAKPMRFYFDLPGQFSAAQYLKAVSKAANHTLFQQPIGRDFRDLQPVQLIQIQNGI